MTHPPQPGQWDPAAPPPSPQQPPPGYYPPPPWGAQQPPPPPSQNNGLKWLLVAVAVLLVIAISVGVTLFFTRDGSDGGGPTKTSSPPTASGGASPARTIPVLSRLSPTNLRARSWRSLQEALAADRVQRLAISGIHRLPRRNGHPSNGRSSKPVGNAMRATADQAVDLAKQTPHRVMRELYEQFIAYGRAYADSLASYVPDDDFLSRANVSLSSAISAICDAIDYGGVIARAADGSGGNPPSQPPQHRRSFGSAAIPDGTGKYVVPTGYPVPRPLRRSCRSGQRLDPKIPASQWTPEQRSIQDRAAARSIAVRHRHRSDSAVAVAMPYSRILPTLAATVLPRLFNCDTDLHRGRQLRQ